MRNTITLNGTASTTIAGLLIQSLPPITKPQQRTTIEEIDGRDGDIVTELGYSAYDKEITIGLYGSFDINAVIAYFATEGTVVFSNEPDKFYRYKIIDKIDYERLVRYRTATVKLHCQPFKYPTSETPVDLTAETVTGEGTDFRLDNTTEAVFSEFTPKGDTSQTTYTGKNLFDGLMEDGGYSQSTGAKVYNYSQGRCVNPISVQPNTTYVVSIDGVKLNVNVRYLYYDASNNILSSEANSNGEFTTPADCYYVTFHSSAIKTAYPNYDMPNMMIEAGTAVTAFEPYVGGIASPNPDYPQPVNVVTSDQTVTILGQNLFDINDRQNTWPTNVSVTSDDWISVGHVNAFTNLYTKKSTFLKPSTTYYTVLEVKEVYDAGTDAYIDVVGAAQNSQSATETRYKFSNLQAGGIYIAPFTTADDFSTATRMIRSYTRMFEAEAYITFRISVVEAQPSANTFQYTPYQIQNYLISLDCNLYNKDEAYKSGNDAYLEIELKPSTTYIFKTGRAWTGAFLYNSSGTQTRKVGNDASSTTSIEFTTTASEVKARLLFYMGSGDIKTYDFTGVLFYEDGTQIELCKIATYQDYIYKSGDNWYVHEEIGKVRLDGTEGWKGTSGPQYSLPKTDTKIAALSLPTYGNLKSFCSHFTKADYDASQLGTYYSGSNNLNFNYDNSHTNLDAFKTWLGSNDVRFYAPLTTATETQITNAILISQLNALANANSYKPTTHIRTASDGTNLPVIIKATTGGDIDGTVTNAGNIYAKPKFTITGSGGIGIYLNGSQMFQIELGTEGHITIDTDAQEAYKDSPAVLKNRLVTGDYNKFKLNPGTNQLAFTGVVTEAIIENYTRWL